MTSLCYWYSESMTRLKRNWILLAYHVTINTSEYVIGVLHPVSHYGYIRASDKKKRTPPQLLTGGRADQQCCVIHV